MFVMDWQRWGPPVGGETLTLSVQTPRLPKSAPLDGPSSVCLPRRKPRLGSILNWRLREGLHSEMQHNPHAHWCTSSLLSTKHQALRMWEWARQVPSEPLQVRSGYRQVSPWFLVRPVPYTSVCWRGCRTVLFISRPLKSILILLLSPWQALGTQLINSNLDPTSHTAKSLGLLLIILTHFTDEETEA